MAPGALGEAEGLLQLEGAASAAAPGGTVRAGGVKAPAVQIGTVQVAASQGAGGAKGRRRGRHEVSIRRGAAAV